MESVIALEPLTRSKREARTNSMRLTHRKDMLDLRSKFSLYNIDACRIESLSIDDEQNLFQGLLVLEHSQDRPRLRRDLLPAEEGRQQRSYWSSYLAEPKAVESHSVRRAIDQEGRMG